MNTRSKPPASSSVSSLNTDADGIAELDAEQLSICPPNQKKKTRKKKKVYAEVVSLPSYCAPICDKSSVTKKDIVDFLLTTTFQVSESGL